MPLNSQNNPLDFKEHKNLGLNPFKVHTKNDADVENEWPLRISKVRPRSYRVKNRNYLQSRVKVNDISFINKNENPDDSLVIFRDENNSSELNNKIKNLKFK